ncbi:hypothetical protein BDM02DRAFT_3114100 [Thelephora ganbajun]|uniref:Uncharacterized protein n=1 Tax=Thelephora ganbajun TaxID=370292 RepID=A0ACB6ZH92_THEGA|nr:hypothetical protein BDM02DRAFT_3114100 [Thelephora ganbajun]
MADPTQIFFKTLCLFSNVAIYANAIHDVSIEDPFLEYQSNGIEIEFEPGFPHIINSWLLPDQPLPPPTIFSAGWFKAQIQRFGRPLLPPGLQFRFPINLIIIAAIPLLIPMVASLLLYRFSKSSKLSRARIKAIEGSDSYQRRLIHIFSHIENRMENALVDVAEIGINTPISQGEQISAVVANNEPKNVNSSSTAKAKPPLITSQARKKSLLTEEQGEMVRSLNTIPNMEKYFVFFTEVINTHGIIISRDPHRFEIHEKGVEILRHWSERFDL